MHCLYLEKNKNSKAFSISSLTKTTISSDNVNHVQWKMILSRKKMNRWNQSEAELQQIYPIGEDVSSIQLL